ncbi:hypothetical protein ROZALSC1DRAFT_29287, partial [Rozella allomycis CSF55]
MNRAGRTEYQSALEEILGLEYFMNVEYELSMKKGDRLKHSRIYRQHDSKFECTDVLIERYHPETKSFDVICLNGECLNVKCTKIMFPFFKESEYFKALKEAKDERRRYIRSRFLDELPKLAKGFKANPKNFKDKDLKYYYHKAMIVGSIIEPQPLKIIEPILCVKGKVQEASKLIKGKHVCLKAVTALNRAITEINEHGFRLNIGEMISFKELEDQIMKHSKFMNRFYTEILPSITTQFATESGLGSFAKPILKSHVSYELNSEVYVIANSLKEERIRVIIPIISNTEAEINEMKGNFINLLKHSLSIYEIDDFLESIETIFAKFLVHSVELNGEYKLSESDDFECDLQADYEKVSKLCSLIERRITKGKNLVRINFITFDLSQWHTNLLMNCRERMEHIKNKLIEQFDKIAHESITRYDKDVSLLQSENKDIYLIAKQRDLLLTLNQEVTYFNDILTELNQKYEFLETILVNISDQSIKDFYKLKSSIYLLPRLAAQKASVSADLMNDLIMSLKMQVASHFSELTEFNAKIVEYFEKTSFENKCLLTIKEFKGGLNEMIQKASSLMEQGGLLNIEAILFAKYTEIYKWNIAVHDFLQKFIDTADIISLFYSLKIFDLQQIDIPTLEIPVLLESTQLVQSTIKVLGNFKERHMPLFKRL